MENDNKKRILVVDDDSNLRNVLIDKLSIAGFEVFGAENGEEGLKKALELHPDLMLFDVIMPKMNGWDLLRTLREDKWGKDARVIMLTVVEDADSVARAMEGGSFVYLIKTDHSLDDIVLKVEEMLK